MTEPTQDAPATDAPADAPAPAPEESTATNDPQDTPKAQESPEDIFPDDSPKTFTLTKAISAAQLMDEVGKVTPKDSQVLLQCEDWTSVNLGAADVPVTVIVVPGKGVTASKVQAALDAHTPDPTYFMNDAQKADQAAIAKVQNADDASQVTQEDLFAALKALTSPAEPTPAAS